MQIIYGNSTPFFSNPKSFIHEVCSVLSFYAVFYGVQKRKRKHVWGRTGLMARASDSGSGDPGSILGRVGVFVSLSERHLLPKSTGNTQE